LAEIALIDPGGRILAVLSTAIDVCNRARLRFPKRQGVPSQPVHQACEAVTTLPMPLSHCSALLGDFEISSGYGIVQQGRDLRQHASDKKENPPFIAGNGGQVNLPE
jgi:hypothetical protein